MYRGYRWIPFWIMILGLVFYAGVCSAAPTDSQNDPLPPEVESEKKVVEYIIGHINDYIEKQDWVNYDPKIHGSKAKPIAEIIEKYGYTWDDYYVNVKSYVNALTKERVYWQVRVSINFKSHKEYSLVEKWVIFIQLEGEGI